MSMSLLLNQPLRILSKQNTQAPKPLHRHQQLSEHRKRKENPILNHTMAVLKVVLLHTIRIMFVHRLVTEAILRNDDELRNEEELRNKEELKKADEL